MTIEQLKSFITVSELQSFIKAANYLFVSHSTLSRHISALETSLGVKLLNRNNRTVQPTAAGKYLYTRGKELLEEFAALEKDVVKVAKQKNGILRLASLNIFNARLDDAYSEFIRENDNDINFVIEYNEMHDIFNQVALDEVDVGLTYSFAVLSPEWECERLKIRDDDMCLIVGEKHHLANREEISFDELGGEKMLFLDNDSLKVREKYQGYMMESDDFASNSPESIILRLRAGVGVAVIPRHLMEGIRGCKVIKLVGVDTKCEEVLFWKRHNANPALEAFVKKVKQHLEA